MTQTKEEIKEYNKKYQLHNKEKLKVQMKVYYEANKEKTKQYQKQWRENNKEKIQQYKKENKDKFKQQTKIWYNKNKNIINEKRKVWKSENKDKVRENSKRYYLKHKEEILKKANTYNNKRLKTDINYNLKCKLKNRIYYALRDKDKSKRTIELLGCTINDFIKHIKSSFTDFMTWDLLMNGEIHLDHIKPCASFDLSKEEEQKKCFHYTNLQALWKVENQHKSSRTDWYNNKEIK